MGKFFSILIIFIFAANTCFALGLELSDIIKEAREAEKLKLSESSTSDNSLKQVKNEITKQSSNEKNACEKINTKELLEQKP